MPVVLIVVVAGMKMTIEEVSCARCCSDGGRWGRGEERVVSGWVGVNEMLRKKEAQGEKILLAEFKMGLKLEKRVFFREHL